MQSIRAEWTVRRKNVREDDAWLVSPKVIELLKKLNGVLFDALATGNPAVQELAAHLVSHGGKRLRPTLLLLAADFGESEERSLLQAAAALELMHVASLYHDDVMDRAMRRRGALSVNFIWGNSLATVGGTFLFARACELLSELGQESNIFASAAAVRLCTGQLQELENAFNVDLTMEDHLEILKAKTATLFQLPCQIGSQLGGLDSSVAEPLLNFAERIGLAFQLMDDALDFSGDSESMGKTTLSDIREGVYSSPILFTLQENGSSGTRIRELLKQNRVSESDIEEIVEIIRGTGAVDSTQRLAQELTESASEYLKELPDCNSRTSLERLAGYCISRTH